MSRVLIVDDEADLASLVEFNLKQEGLETVVAANGAQALALSRAKPVDLVILDLMLPDISGRDVCRQLRAHPATASVPVVMLTARGEEQDRVGGFEVGADDYVTKPFSPRELVWRVRALLRRSTGTPTSRAPIALGNLSVDTTAHRVWVDQVEVALTALEFRLLLQFATRPGRMQTREQLLAEVWNITSPIETRTVDTHVMRLRDKLGTAGELIETVRGVGYRLTDAQTPKH